MRNISGASVTPWYIASAIALVVAATGGWLTKLGPWYRQLVKPVWQPPDWLFAPAWTVIFICATVAAVKGWRGLAGGGREAFVIAFAINGVLNMLWSLLFFRTQRPDWALIEVAVLWLSIVVLIAMVWNRVHEAALWLLPYLAWVSFAAFLNFTIVKLNRPFTVSL